MKIKTAIILIIIIALAAGLWAALGSKPTEVTHLVPAWVLTPPKAYDGQSVKDEVISWSPDSKSLLFSLSGTKYYQMAVLHWNVGEKQIENLVKGVSANYLDNSNIIYLWQNPMTFYQRGLTTGRTSVIVPNVRKVDFWKEISGFTYNPTRKSLILRFEDFTRYYQPGTTEIDLTGKTLGSVPRTTGDAILCRSDDPKSWRSAVIVGQLSGNTQELRISRKGEENKAKTLASGNLGAVAYSPDGRAVAFGDANEVKLLNLINMKTVTVARFGNLPASGQPPYVSRLYWSPNGSYLAVLELLPTEYSCSAMVYVLDMSKIER